MRKLILTTISILTLSLGIIYSNFTFASTDQQENNIGPSSTSNRPISQLGEPKSAVPSIPSSAQLADILDRFEQYAIKAQKDWQVPGFAAAIVQNDKIVYAKGFGVKDINGGDTPENKVDTHTIFQIASMSKSFTAALIGMLVDEKKFSWNDKLTKLYPDFKLYDPWVTKEFMLKDLLAQHSGLPANSTDSLAFFGYDREHVIKTLKYIKPIANFRSDYAYQNNLFVLAGELIAKYTGKSWEDNVDERIFQPLGMNESSISPANYRASSNVVALHMMHDGKVFAGPLSWNSYFYGIDTYAAAGGINSNVIDMTKWLIFNMGDGKFGDKQLLSEDNMDVIHTPQTLTMLAPKSGHYKSYYTMGWVYDDSQPYPILWHTGGSWGAASIMAICPNAKVGIVVLTNMANHNLPAVLMKSFFDLYFNNKLSLDWEKMAFAQHQKALAQQQEMLKKPAIITAPTLPLAKYAGVYQNDVYGKLEVKVENNHLVAIFGERPTKFTLQPWDKDKFEFIWPAEGPGYYPPIADEDSIHGTFKVTSGGKVENIVIDLLDKDDNLGTFRKMPGAARK